MLIKKISPWGTGSQCLPVPKDVLDLLNLEIGDNVTIEIKEGKIIISPITTIKNTNKEVR
jgi:antitoxin component of MazEF toxin-antitoxin module